MSRRFWHVQGFIMKTLRVMVSLALLLLLIPDTSLIDAGSLNHGEPIAAISDAVHDISVPALMANRDASQEASYTLLVDVVVDEEFLAVAGQQFERVVEEIFSGANELLSPLGVKLEVASVNQWHSDDGVKSLRSLLTTVESQTQRTPGHLLLAITCQDSVKYDGWAQPTEARVITQFYHTDQWRNPMLVAHEVGHLLGTRHHEDDEACHEEGCIMDQQVYDRAYQWCDHHTEVIREHLQRIATF